MNETTFQMTRDEAYNQLDKMIHMEDGELSTHLQSLSDDTLRAMIKALKLKLRKSRMGRRWSYIGTVYTKVQNFRAMAIL